MDLTEAALTIVHNLDLGRQLRTIWKEQQDYNTWVKNTEGEHDPADWTTTYLLGVVSEVDEVLRELNWKKHRKDRKTPIKSNIARELADITKFTLSLWQTWGFTPEQMLEYVAEKNEILKAQWYIDHNLPMHHKLTILFDLDGTVANYRKGLTEYLESEAGATDERQMFYEMDLATGLDYEVYHHHKDQFEETGGYRRLPGYSDALWALESLMGEVNLCAVTARPKYLARAWADTYYWLKERLRAPDRLWLAGGERLKYAKMLRDQGYEVVCWEDAPVEALRYAEHDFDVWMRDQPYNQNVSHERIHRVTYFRSELREYFRKV